MDTPPKTKESGSRFSRRLTLKFQKDLCFWHCILKPFYLRP
ncbi:hypothetical protein LEMLEM_LOCUS24073 [Lemmus lemmus]